LLLAAALFLIFGEYARRVRIVGVVLPSDGLTRIVAPQAGWVAALEVTEGKAVRRGDVLYTLRIGGTTALGNTQDTLTELLQDKRTRLDALLIRQAKIDTLDKQALVAQKQDVMREIVQMDDQLSKLEQFAQQMQSFAARHQELLARGLATSGEYEARLQASNNEQAQLARLRRERLQLAARLNAIGNELAGFDLSAAVRRDEIHRQLLDIKQQLVEVEARREVKIIAPRDGKVTGIITRTGQTVDEGTPLLTIVPENDKPLVAQLLAPSNAIGFMREGSEVLLRYEAFPYQKFGQYPGKVSLISRANLRPEEVAQLNAGGRDSNPAATLYRITVRPDDPHVIAYGRPQPLQAGMQVEAHVLLEKRPLYQWVLSPLYSLRGSLATSAEG
jgi:membrane fusion protein